jgi:uncharacterized membrane-anchored protein YjiN (DUF445 family)
MGRQGVADPAAGTPPRRVRPKRRLALAVLLAAAGLAVAVFPFRATWWGGWLLAIAEAGVVGGLADWFAVTAIFRRPLGLPIPHTALIPANWELMAQRVGSMVGDRVLTREYVAREIDRIDVAGLLARGALQLTPGDIASLTQTVARWLGDQLPAVTGADAVRRLLAVIRTWPLAPALARGLELAREQGLDQRLITATAEAVSAALERPMFRAAVTDVVDDLLVRYWARVGLYPRLLLSFADLFGMLDRQRMVGALHAGLREVARDPGHPLRRQIDEALAALPKRLREDGALAARVEAVKAELLDGEPLAGVVVEVMAALQRALKADLAAPESHMVAWVVERLEEVRRRLVEDETLRADLGQWAKRHAIDLVERYHGRMSAFIENGVRALGPEGAVRLIEEHAGDDLQYIRVNGTVIGGLAGGAIYGVHLLLRLL